MTGMIQEEEEHGSSLLRKLALKWKGRGKKKDKIDGQLTYKINSNNGRSLPHSASKSKLASSQSLSSSGGRIAQSPSTSSSSTPPPPSAPPPPPPPPPAPPPPPPGMKKPGLQIKKAAAKKDASGNGPRKEGSFLEELARRQQSSAETRMTAIESASKSKLTKSESPNDKLLAEIKGLKPNTLRRVVKDVAAQPEGQRKTFLNPLMQEISRLKPKNEERAAAMDKVEQMITLRKVTPNFTLQTRKKVNDSELEGAKGALKKVGGLEDLEGKLSRINQENYRRMRDMAIKADDEPELFKIKPRKVQEQVSSNTGAASNALDESDDDGSTLVSILQSIMNPNSAKADDSTIGSDLEDDEEWNSEKDGKDKDEDTEEDLVSFLLSNVMPKPKRSASSKKQGAKKEEEIGGEAIEKKVEKRLEDIKSRIEMKMENSRVPEANTSPQTVQNTAVIQELDINEPEKRRLENLEEEILQLGKELEDLKTQTIDDPNGELSDDDEEDPFLDDDDNAADLLHLDGSS